MKRIIQIIVACVCALSLISIAGYFYVSYQAQPFFYIVCPTYNNEEWCIKNLEAVVQQSYSNWKMVIINDCSTDRTSTLLHEYVMRNNLQHKVLIVDNKQRCKACRNIYDAIHGCCDTKVHILPACPDHAIVILYDGDDFLAHTYVLDRLVTEYKNPVVWMTHGTYKTWPTYIPSCCAPVPEHVMKQRLFRAWPYTTSHLRTFKAWLFKKIKRHDLLYQGEFYPTTWDLAMMFPMLEMASQGHIRHIPDILYLYNIATPLNDYKVHAELQQKLAQHLRSLPRYTPLPLGE